MKAFYLFLLLTACLPLSTTGCLSWQPGWKQFRQSLVNEDVDALLAQAEKKVPTADTKEKLLDVIKTYEAVLQSDPKHHTALMEAGRYCVIMGFGYMNTNDEKATYYLKAIQHLEQLMYLNPDFKELADKGENVWDACRALSDADMESLFFWYISSGIYWKECMKGFNKLFTMHWLFRAKKVLIRITEIDPTWRGGMPYYAWGNYYAVAPSLLGGDVDKSEAHFKKAIELGPEVLNFRAMRAIHLHVKTKNREAFQEDLNWVLTQDPRQVRKGFTYPFNVYIQRKAEEELAKTDEYFGK